MKIKIIHGEKVCPPCESIITTIQELALTDPELNLNYEIFIKGTLEAESIIDEHLNRGFPLVGAPLWILYDEEDRYVKTFLGFPLIDYEHRLEDLKQSILLNHTEFEHPLEPINFPSK
jgi:hypothetical protein